MISDCIGEHQCFSDECKLELRSNQQSSRIVSEALFLLKVLVKLLLRNDIFRKLVTSLKLFSVKFQWKYLLINNYFLAEIYMYSHSRRREASRMNYAAHNVEYRGCFRLEYQFIEKGVGFIILYAAHGQQTDSELNRIYSYNKTKGKWYSTEVPTKSHSVSVPFLTLLNPNFYFKKF